MSTVFDDFQDAWVGRVYFGEGASRLADARQRMEAHPDYDLAKYIKAVFRAELRVSSMRRLVASASGYRP
jgi:hypothetical protein